MSFIDKIAQQKTRKILRHQHKNLLFCLILNIHLINKPNNRIQRVNILFKNRIFLNMLLVGNIKPQTRENMHTKEQLNGQNYQINNCIGLIVNKKSLFYFRNHL